jgi:phosphoglycolate phosphatase
MKYKLVIFDFDGTLADSFPWLLGALEELADRHRLHRLPKTEVERLRGETTAVILKELGVTFWKLPALARDLRALANRDRLKITLFEGIGAVLQELSERGATLAVVSSNSRENVQAMLGPGHAARIRHYECGVSISGKAARLRRVLRHCEIPAGGALFIGDELRDGEAARKAGIAFGAVSWGYARPEVLRAQAPEEMFSQVGEIVDRIG